MGAIILAGGRGERIGRPKADIRLKDKSLLCWVCDALSEIPGGRLVVAASPPKFLPPGTRCVQNEPAGCGRLGALFAGLSASKDNVNFVVGCDRPFILPSLVKLLLELAENYEVVVPRIEGRLHPLCAVYTKFCLQCIREALGNKERRITAFYPMVNVRYVEAETLRKSDPELISLFDINTTSDLLEANRMAKYM